MPPDVARQLWHLLEPYHAVVYFADEVRAAATGAGLKGFWMGYFAMRASPMGAVGPGVVTATFFNFAPSMVERALPDAWSFASVEEVRAARQRGVDAALRRILGEGTGSADLAAAADLARRAVEGCVLAGRPLYAANAAVSWPDEPHLALWHAATLLREFRGDGHVAALVAAGLDGCEAHVSLVRTGAVERRTLQPARGWTDDEWDAAEERLDRRGWTTRDRERVEQLTDRLAARPFDHLGDAGVIHLRELLTPLATAVAEGAGIPFPNPMGLPAPS